MFLLRRDVHGVCSDCRARPVIQALEAKQRNFNLCFALEADARVLPAALYVLQPALARVAQRRLLKNVITAPPLVYRLSNNEKDVALLQEHGMHTAGEVRRMQGVLQTVRIRGQVNLILRAPRAAVGRRAAATNTSLQRG